MKKRMQDDRSKGIRMRDAMIDGSLRLMDRTLRTAAHKSPKIFALYLQTRLEDSGMTREEARSYQAAFIQGLRELIPIGGKDFLRYGKARICFERTGENTFQLYKV